MKIHKRRDSGGLYVLVILLFMSAFVANCARPSSPIGGPKDTIPPIIKDINPQNFQTNLYPKNIVFDFNEFMQLKDATSEVLISPLTNIRPTVEVNGRRIITKFTSDIVLDSNTTYVIDYGRALQDINEGNPAREIKYVFSTGDIIDSLTMAGQVVDANSGDTLVNALVFIYEQIADSVTIDSTLFNGKVLGMYTTDSMGVFMANYLQGRDYRVFAIDDSDKNKIYTQGKDKVGFIDYAINPLELEPFKVWYDPITRQIYASPQFRVRVFSEKPYLPQSIEAVTSLQKGRIDIKFATHSAVVDSLSVAGIEPSNLIIMPSLNRDSITVWIRSLSGEIPDTLDLSFRYLGRDSIGQPAMRPHQEQVILINSKPLTSAQKRAIKRGDKPTLWQRIVMWFRFRYRANLKRENERQRIEYQHLIDSIKNNPEAIAAFKRDSLRLDSIRIDSLRLDSLIQDSITKMKLDSLTKIKLYINPQSEFNPKNRLVISYDYPIESILKDSIELFKYAAEQQDEDFFDEKAAASGKENLIKTKVPFSFVQDTTTLLRQQLVADWESDVEYEILLLPKAFQDILGRTNDTISHKFKSVERRNMTQFEIEAISVKGSYIMDIVKDSKSVEYSTIVTKDSTYIFDLLPVGNYQIRITNDLNSNGKFDDGNLVRRLMPEEIVFYKDEKGNTSIETRKNFEFFFTVDFSKLFAPISTDKNINDE